MTTFVEWVRRVTMRGLDSFVSEPIRLEGADAIRRARLIVSMSLIGIVSLLAAGFVLKGLVPATAILAPIVATVMAGVPFLLRRSASVHWPATLLTGLAFAFIAGLALAAGPKAITTVTALVLIPVVAISLTGSREGARWTIAACAVIAILMVLGHAGVAFPLAPQGEIQWQRVIPIIFLVEATIGSLALASERLRERATLQLREAHSELRRTNAITADREAQMRAILDTAAEGILTVDESGRVASFNRAAAEIFGYAPEEVIGRDASVLLDIQANEDLAASWPVGLAATPQDCTAALGETQSIHKEIEGLRRDGSTFPMALALSSSSTETSRVLSLIVRDRTEEQAIQSQLMQAQRLESVGQLSAGVAHEINTPTQFVGDNLAFLAESVGEMSALVKRYRALVTAAQAGVVPAAEIQELQETENAVDIEYLQEEIPHAIEQAREGVARVARIVSAMKEFSHPGSDDKQLVDLNRAIESTVTVARNEWKYVAEMGLELDPELPQVPCFVAPFNQVVLNLVVNAAHALGERGSDEMGHITIRTRSEGDHVVVEVSDDGSGIPEEIRSRIFDPFFTTKEVGRGTGQGLAITQQVVANHGGTIRVESEVGRGSTFHITLPLKTQAAQPQELA